MNEYSSKLAQQKTLESALKAKVVESEDLKQKVARLEEENQDRNLEMSEIRTKLSNLNVEQISANRELEFKIFSNFNETNLRLKFLEDFAASASANSGNTSRLQPVETNPGKLLQDLFDEVNEIRAKTDESLERLSSEVKKWRNESDRNLKNDLKELTVATKLKNKSNFEI